ncbi:MAG: prepilin-type N-terminal cleavage/methylation domain-containing protein [Sulfurimicrobium sp.]|nr:prepilin-type N-terminal cleavage/methylation domain-containing protein [Sulfurimicrobium sp.]
MERSDTHQTPNPSYGPPRGGGFTLLETLIALVIAAVAASVILSHVRTLMLRSEKEQAHQTVVLQLLNDSLRLTHGAMPAEPVARIEKDELWIDLTDKDWAGMPPVRVSNFSARGEALPPVSFAYTPYQLYGTARDRYALFAIAPSLKPPAGVTSGSYLPMPLPDKPPEAPVPAAPPVTPVPAAPIAAAETPAASPSPASASAAPVVQEAAQNP